MPPPPPEPELPDTVLFVRKTSQLFELKMPPPAEVAELPDTVLFVSERVPPIALSIGVRLY